MELIKKLNKPLTYLVAVGLLAGTVQFCKKPVYSYEILKEAVKMCSDSLLEKSPKLNNGELYIDPHMHLLKPSNYKGGIEEIVNTAMDKVDVMVMMGHENILPGELGYGEFKESIESTNYKIIDYGSYLKIRKKNDMLFVIGGQELTCKGGREVLAIGCEGLVKPYQSVKDTIKEVHEKKGIAIIAHPMTHNREGLIPLSQSSKKEVKDLEEVCYDADALESFNPQNYLWMFTSNVSAKLFIKKHNLPGTTGSDSKYDLSQIGLSGIIVKKSDLYESNLVESLRTVLKSKNFKNHEKYTNPFSFLKLTIKFFKYREK